MASPFVFTLVIFSTLAGSLYLQSRLWSDEEGWGQYQQLMQQKARKEQELTHLHQTNQFLAKEIEALKLDPEKIQGIARQELGYIKPDEAWIQVLPLQPPTPTSP
jgi:cell division protein FtsB